MNAVRRDADPLRALAQERGRLLAELGVRPEDARWTQMEADALASLVEPALSIRMPDWATRLVRSWSRWLR